MLKKISTTFIALLMSANIAVSAEFINILTGGTSGVYYPLGVGLSKIYGEKIEGSKVQVQSTKASVENLNLIQSGKGEIAFVLGDSVKYGWEGNAEAGFQSKLDNLRGIAGIYPNYVHIVASKSSNINSIEDLKGKRVSVGAPKSGTELQARAILKAAGMSYEDLGKVEYLPFGQSVELIKNRQIDATVQSAGLGVASIKDLANSVEVVIVEIPESLIEKLGAPYVSATIPANTYQGVAQDTKTAGIVNFLITSQNVSDQTAYDMTKNLFENLPALVATHSAAKNINIDKALTGMPVPLHPGAEKYYKEKGIVN
ncbi:MAG: TAXI family TRAP transporter solute-binding subunit [Candidatus Pelagibacter sp.]|jgi:TRAP transporter TAXI family solute receptor|nr:TAXI family TRAP transporter solute-binding subunit [Pseudomonadota bacterium]NCX65274.1 TAXI family TRAP transporter solute-binding subunit [Pseudomonadota bacterium]